MLAVQITGTRAAAVLTVSLPTTPSEKNEGNRSITARIAIWFPVGICAKANWPFGEMYQMATKQVQELTGTRPVAPAKEK
jgi:hypothetical protein